MRPDPKNASALHTARTRSAGRPPLRRRRGVALALVLLALAVCIVLGAVFLTTSGTTSQIAHAGDHRLRARMIAESGLAIARAYIDDDPGWRTSRPNGVWINNQAFGGGTFTVRGEDGEQINNDGTVAGDGNLADDPLDPVTLTSVGTSGRHRYLLRATLNRSSANAVAVSERITISGAGVVDSYSSRSGPYSLLNRGQAAVISSNDVARPHVTLRNSARVRGNLFIGPGGDPAWAVQVQQSAAVTGTTGTLPAPVPFATPVEPSLGPSIGNVRYSGGTTALTADLHCNDLTVDGTAIVRVQGDRRVVVDGNLAVGQNAVVQVGVPSPFGVAVKGGIQLLDRSLIDSYDSSARQYDATTARPSALVGTNATAAGVFTVVAGAALRGDAFSGVGSNPASAISAPASAITGSRSALQAAMNIPAPAPWPFAVPVSAGNFEKSNGTKPIRDENLHVDSFRLTGGAKLLVHGDCIIRVNREFVVDDTASIVLQPHSTLRVYVQEYVKIGAGVQVNAHSKEPWRFTIHTRGSGYEHTILGNAEVYGVIDSPNSSLTVSDTAQVYGAFMGQSLLLKGRAQIHHDRSATVGAANPRLPVTSAGDRLTVYTKGSVTIAGDAQLNVNTSDPTRLVFNHLAGTSFDVRGSSTAYATVVAPDAAWHVQDQAVYHGKARARDLKVGGTASVYSAASGGTSDPGLLAKETIDLSGSAVLTGVDGSAVIATNATSTLAIVVEDVAALRGSAYTGPNGSVPPAVYRAETAQITGAIGSLPRMVPIALPGFPRTMPPYGNRVYNGNRTSTINGLVDCGDFTIGDNAVVEIDGQVTITMTGRWEMRDQGRLRLRPGAKLTVFCPATVRLLNDARLNEDGDPASVVLNAAGSAVDLSQNARAFATIVAPSAELTVSDTAHLFGSYLGRRLRVRSQGQVHFDDSSPPRVTWIEQK